LNRRHGSIPSKSKRFLSLPGLLFWDNLFSEKIKMIDPRAKIKAGYR